MAEQGEGLQSLIVLYSITIIFTSTQMLCMYVSTEDNSKTIGPIYIKFTNNVQFITVPVLLEFSGDPNNHVDSRMF